MTSVSPCTQEAAVRAYDAYVEDGVAPATHGASSQFKGIRWDKREAKWKVTCKGTYLGGYATEQAAAQAYNKYVEDGVDPVTHRDGTSSQFKGVTWNKSAGKWTAQCKGTHLGYHATEEAAARAHDEYVKDGVDPVTRGDPSSTSRFKGVHWDKRRGKWKAECKRKGLGYHVTEEAAAQAYNNYVKDSVDPVPHRDRDATSTSTSQFQGVRFNKRSGKWRASCNGKHLGCHATEAWAYTRQLLSSTCAVLVSEPFCVQFVASYDPCIY